MGDPRLLVVSGTPPDQVGVGGQILRAFFSDYPDGRVAFVELRGSASRPDVVPGFPHPVHRLDATAEGFFRRWRSPWRSFRSFVHFRTGYASQAHVLVEEATAIGRELGAERVLLVLNSISAIAVGERVARALGVPMVSLIWDAPESFLFRTDRLTRSALMGRFRSAVARSERVGVVSREMADAYVPDGTPAVIVRYAESERIRAAPGLPPEEDFRFGFAGSAYAASAIDAFLRGLDEVEWEICGRKISLTVLSSNIRLRSRTRARVHYLGYGSPGEVVDELASCDAFLLPVPFEPESRSLALYSFPTKLSTYVALGRPVFSIAPAGSAVARFAAEHELGPCVTSLEPDPVVEGLETLLQPDSYRRFATHVASVARAELSEETFLRRFAELVGADVERTADRTTSGAVAVERS